MFNLIGNLAAMPLLGLLTPPSGAEYMALIPGSIMVLVALIVILVDTFHRPGTRRDYLAYVGAIGSLAAIFSAYVLWDNTIAGPTFHGMLYLDKYAMLFAVIACAAGGLAMLQGPAYLTFQRMDRGEFYMLILFSVAGSIFMASAADMLSIFLALEVMSIPVYCLAGFLRREAKSAESAMKYFILGAFSAGLMLYGMALIYGVTGTTNLEYIGRNLAAIIANTEASAASGLVVVLGVMLVLSGFAFKIAAAPFHLWSPDVYEGSPSPGVGFMATAVKAGAFAAMIRVLFIAFEHESLKGGFYGIGWLDVLFFLSAASMILGNAAAITQINVKRMLAYSSIAHSGYILLGVVSAGSATKFFLHNDAVLFYLITYTFGTVGAFGVLSYLGRSGRSVETYEDLNGLGLKYPFAGVVMGIFMFSSAGVPPTAGFVGKLFVFRSAVDVGSSTGEFSFIGLAILGVLTSVAGAYYYLKVLVHMYMKKQTHDRFEESTDRGAKLSIGICAALTLLLGIVPGTALELSREAIVDFQGGTPAIKEVQKQGQQALDAMNAKSAAAKIDAVKLDAP